MRIKATNRRLTLAALTLLPLVGGCHRVPPIKQLAGTPNWAPDPAHAQELKTEETGGNGIEVGQPQIYDDASLRMMLDATRAKLASMSGLDQGSLIKNLGSISGATISQSQFALQVTGGGPSTQTTNTGATNSLTTNGGLPQGNATIPGTTSVTTDPTQSTVTTSPTAPAVPTAPSGLAFTPPSSVSPSSLDILNEQMQLSYELTNLQLLLEGALSDRFVLNQRFVKPKVTIGFPISLRTPPQFKDAVAVVEVEVTTSPANLSDTNVPEPPAITALLPREKTYNVAAMTDRITSIGGGAVLGPVGVAGSYTRGRKTLYLVQDQDTIAMRRPVSENKNSTSFFWEFRPVLGQHYLRNGMKQTFVQLALPVLENVDCFGTVKVRTYWRHFDQKNGIDKNVIPESLLTSTRTFPIPRYDLAPQVDAVSYEDLGDGTVLVHVAGNYLAGTYVRLGSTRYDAGKSLLVEDAGVTFTAPIASLARWTPHLVARSGVSSDILVPLSQTPLPRLNQTACVGVSSTTASCAPPAQPQQAASCGEQISFAAGDISVHPLDEASSIVTLSIHSTLTHNKSDLLLSIGGKVFGLKDAPVQRQFAENTQIMTVVVPTSLLISNPQIKVFLPFWSGDTAKGSCYIASAYLGEGFGPDSAIEHLVLVSVDQQGNAMYLLYGNGLAGAKLLAPQKGVSLEAVDSVNRDRIALLRVTKDASQGSKKILLQKADGQRPLPLDIPDTKAASPKLSVDTPVIVNTEELDVSADNAADVTDVKMGDKSLKWKLVDKSTIRLLNLQTDGVTSEQKTREISVVFKSGAKGSYKFEVVAARIGVR